jgi:hypothetical protein
MRMRIASMLLAAALGVTLTSAPVGGQPATVPATGPVTVVVRPGPAPAAVAPTAPQTVVAQPGQAVVLQPGQTIAQLEPVEVGVVGVDARRRPGGRDRPRRGRGSPALVASRRSAAAADVAGRV